MSAPERPAPAPGRGVIPRLAVLLERRSGLALAGFVLLTGLLVIPLVALEPDEDASQEPDARVFELRDEFEARLEPVFHGNVFIVEARGGDVLTQVALSELLANQEALLAADQRGELAPEGRPAQRYLLERFSASAGVRFRGMFSIANGVDEWLRLDSRFDTTLAEATEDEVKRVLALLLAEPRTAQLRDQLAVSASSDAAVIDGESIPVWRAPAVAVTVFADNALLGGGPSRGGISGDERILDKEEFNRRVQSILRGEEASYRLWGVAIDQQLESEDEGQTAGVFIMLAVVTAVGVVGLALRSYWVTALTGAGLGALMIWLGGISNLVGLKGGLIIELIVPIAMVALGVDFAVHAVRRYQEERASGLAPRRAFGVGMAGVGAALILAMVSDGIAFLSNSAAGIEVVVHFGIAAAVASVCSFLVLGVAVPIAAMRLDEVAPLDRAGSRLGHGLLIAAGVGASLLAGAVVLISIAVSAPLGAGLLALAALLTIGVPLVLARQGRGAGGGEAATDTGPQSTAGSWLGKGVAGLAVRWPIVLPTVGLLTAGAVALALQLVVTFDAKDFFDSSSDFVVSLDKLEEHLGDTAGEPATFVLEGDLANPETLVALTAFSDRLSAGDFAGQDEDGDLNLFRPNLLSVVARLMAVPGVVEEATGVPISDADGDGLPDSSAQGAALLEYALAAGVPAPDGTSVRSVAEVESIIDYAPGRAGYTALTVGLPDSRRQSTVTAARLAFEADLAPLAASASVERVGLVGSPFEREQTLIATTDSLLRSLPIAAVAALMLLLVVFRSLRYAVVTVIPVGLVAAWLYALMYLAGFSLNFVTATIGAVSIGVGIDYSIHMTARFREELRRRGDAQAAIARAAAGTGVALVASAGSTILGFAIMGFAPMPLFASYGILTAVMITLALAGSLLVLPGLLLLVSRGSSDTRGRR